LQPSCEPRLAADLPRVVPAPRSGRGDFLEDGDAVGLAVVEGAVLPVAARRDEAEAALVVVEVRPADRGGVRHRRLEAPRRVLPGRNLTEARAPERLSAL